MRKSPLWLRQVGVGGVAYRGSWIAREGEMEAKLDPWPETQLLLFDASWRAAITVEGADARKWLNGMISANVRDLAPGRMVPSFQLDPKGHVLATLDVACAGADRFLLLTDEAQQEALEQRLSKFVFISKVKLENRSQDWTALRLRGPGAAAAAREAGLVVPQVGEIAALDGGWVAAENPGGITQVEFIAPVDAAVALWDRLRPLATPAGGQCQERDRILSRQPLYGQDITAAELPQETGQPERLSFTKGCYIGQEIVERIRARGAVHRHWSAFRFDAPVEAGAELELEGRAAGRITSATAHEGGWFALGYIRDAVPGQTVMAGGVAGQLME